MIAVPDASAVLDAADRGRSAPWIDRGLAIAALAGIDLVRLGGDPVGRLQDAVLALHEAMCGPELAATTVCPSCAAVVEFRLDVAMLRGAPEGPRDGCLELGDATVAWRAPTAGDLGAVAASADPASALRDVCLTVTIDGRPAAASALGPDALAVVESRMAEADPLAEVLVEVACAECEARFDADVDPIGFVWAELESRALRLLREVDELARVYGWTEEVVLGLPGPRRAAYLAIVRGDSP